MYCKKCGKFITSDAVLCNECTEEMLKTEQPSANKTQTYTAKPQTQTVQKGSRMQGFGKALIAAIIPEVAVIVGIIGFLLGGVGMAEGVWMQVTGIVLLFIAIAMCVLAIVFGAKSISLANSLARDGYKRPIATMVCGIVGLAAAILVAFVLFIYLMMLISIPYMLPALN